jgi:hypothetical protein
LRRNIHRLASALVSQVRRDETPWPAQAERQPSSPETAAGNRENVLMPVSNAERQKAYRRRNAELRNDDGEEISVTLRKMLSVLCEIKELIESLRYNVTNNDGKDLFPPLPPLGSPLDSLPNPPIIPPLQKAPARGSRLSDEWSLSEADNSFAEKLGLNIGETFDSFCDYWRSKPGQAGSKLDWSATWRNWCRKTPPQRKHSSNGHAGDVPGHSPMYGPPQDAAVLMAKILASSKGKS